MAQSLAQVYLHLVFSTKDRRPFLCDPEIRKDVHAYLAGICQNVNSPSLIVGGVEDHVHVLCRLGREIAIAVLLREIKRESSKMAKTKGPGLEAFHWQLGYGAFSVSPAHIPALKEYIANQEGHHRTETFQDEFRRLLKKYGVEYDERYVWD